jgi:hypothetical protein
VIDTASGTVTTNLALPTGSHSLYGICISPDGQHAFVTHILSRYFIPTTQVLRGWINTDALTVIHVPSLTVVNTVLLDDLDEGAANPWGVACSEDGAYLCVAHAGSHEISVIDRAALMDKLAVSGDEVPNDLTYLAGIRRRIPLAGKGPRSIVMTGGKVFAAEYFSDTIGAADLAPGAVPLSRSIPLGWRRPLDTVRTGELYFHDATLCLQTWQSCSSCHPGVRSDALNWDLLNDGFGNPKNSRSLLLSHVTPPAMISGIRADAETAVRAGLRYIQFVNRPESDAIPIDEFLKAQQPVPSPHLEEGQWSEAALRGAVLFQSAGCSDCHSGPRYTNLQRYDVGTGEGREAGWAFDTPTLVEVWRTAPYLYDGRAATIRDVLTTFNPANRHGATSALSTNQVDDLVEFILSL